MLASSIAQAKNGNLPTLSRLLCLSLGRTRGTQDPWLPCWGNSASSSHAPLPFRENPNASQTSLPIRKEPNFQIPLQVLNALLSTALPGTSPGSVRSGTANICIPEHGMGRGPVWSCHIFTALSQELYHKLITHTSLHHEIKQVRDGIAACCHKTAPSS